MPDAQCARSLVCKLEKAHKHSHHGHTGTAGIPRAMVLRVPSCSSRGPGFLAPVIGGSFRRLDASVGTPEPHDFAVRDGTFVRRAIASTASRTQRS
jgi:hypothetical protein